MRIQKLALLPILGSLLYAAAASGQQLDLAQHAASAPIRLDVVATQSSGAPVADLQQRDFTVLDNKAPQPITSFKVVAGPQAPVEVTIVIDALNISYLNLGRESEEVTKFLRANGGQLAHPTALVIFGEQGFQVLSGATKDGNALSSALAGYDFKLRTIRRSQGIYGAEERFQISVGALRLLAQRETTRPGRKIVLWVSPGWPLLSGPGIQLDWKQDQRIFDTIVDLSTQMREANLTLYSIDSLGVDEPLGRVTYYQAFLKGVSKPQQIAVGDLSLQVLATQTGGLVLNSTAVAELLEKCVSDTQVYYELVFAASPAEQRDEYHHVQVQLATPGLTARTRDGYYSQP